ncbi:hypothetical protein E5720_12650 [Rhodococcus sp. PAMC28707]|uniref:hypothetical protein n=1 Tax=unclassified Rhodococcus (in: high G+C Gram-positive bacteria) TaxID=192944 RepID=UPI00109DCDF8|nr:MULTISPECIES: hypothetical protein [unclassified Rhodococcus (in: high G+C Gram-positive bacteria)]QCB49093.1 hypothetical protein E5769_01365 [Rhodococcus sp. PAMC28705]QCB59219.1 hypothetical protein E5720_12650 [Rhodococcus sp. PAMC28707]
MSLSWAKAPDFAQDPERIEEIHAQTVRDKENYLDSSLAPVECRACGTSVLVRKNSSKQTSVQWTTRPADTCPVFRDAGNSATQDSCPRMQDSIDHAVMEGILSVPSD